jgi:hypothetical protein
MKTAVRYLILFLLFVPVIKATEKSEEFINVFVAPQQELIVIQWKHLNTENLKITLSDKDGKQLNQTTLFAGTTIAYFDTQTLYSGEYKIQVTNGKESFSHILTLTK